MMLCALSRRSGGSTDGNADAALLRALDCASGDGDRHCHVTLPEMCAHRERPVHAVSKAGYHGSLSADHDDLLDDVRRPRKEKNDDDGCANRNSERFANRVWRARRPQL